VEPALNLTSQSLNDTSNFGGSIREQINASDEAYDSENVGIIKNKY
jgi:hypothetical protein